MVDSRFGFPFLIEISNGLHLLLRIIVRIYQNRSICFCFFRTLIVDGTLVNIFLAISMLMLYLELFVATVV